MSFIMPDMTTMKNQQDQHINHDRSCCETDHEEVALAAFRLYEKRGSQDGQCVKNWLEAETRVKEMRAATVHGMAPITKSDKQTVR
jgi:hypothetical protein